MQDFEDADEDDESTTGPPVPRTLSRIASEVNAANRLPKAEVSEEKVQGSGIVGQLGAAMENEISCSAHDPVFSGPVCKLR